MVDERVNLTDPGLPALEKMACNLLAELTLKWLTKSM